MIGPASVTADLPRAHDRVLITGGSGFIGTNLLAAWLERGAAVLNFDVRAPRQGSQQSFWRRGDLLDADAVREVLEEFRPRIVFHLAARTDLEGRSLADYPANIQGVANLVSALEANRQPPERVIFASTVFVFQRGYQPKHETDYCPYTIYGASKVEGERIVRAARLPCAWTIVRPTSIWGPWFGVPFRPFFEAIRHGYYVHPRGVRLMRTLGFVLNTVDQLDAIATADAAAVRERSFFLGDPCLEMGEWADTVATALGRRRPPRVPVWMLRSGGKMGDFFMRLGVQHPPLTSFRVRNLLTSGTVDLAPTLQVTGPARYSTLAGAALTAQWLTALTSLT